MTSAARELMLDAATRNGLTGVAMAVLRRGEPATFECTGVAHERTGRAITPDTCFRIASISKTMTAIGVLQLRDRGLLGLDDPVNDHLRTFTVEPPPRAPPVTCRHLLTHTAGIGEVPRASDFVRRDAWGMGAPRVAPADLASVYRGTFRTEVGAGTKWAYANHGFAVLAQVVEDVSGTPFADHMRTHLFEPLGMATTGYVRTDAIHQQLAVGHSWILGRLRTGNDYDLALLGPGSVLSSAADMARYAAWLVSGATSAPDVLAPATLAEMLLPQYAVADGVPGMGLAFWVGQLGPHRTAGHDGNVPGFASALLFAPDDGAAVVVLTNTATMIGAHLLAEHTLRAVLGAGDEGSDTATVAEQPYLWRELTGAYGPRPGLLTNTRVWQTLGGEIDITVRGRRLVLRSLSLLPALRRGVVLRAADAANPLHFVADVEGLHVDVVFERNEAGAVDRVAIGPPSNTVFHRRSQFRSARQRWRMASGLGALLLLRRVLRRRR